MNVGDLSASARIRVSDSSKRPVGKSGGWPAIGKAEHDCGICHVVARAIRDFDRDALRGAGASRCAPGSFPRTRSCSDGAENESAAWLGAGI